MAKTLSWSGDSSTYDDGYFQIVENSSTLFTGIFSADSNPWGKTKNCYNGATATFNADGTIDVTYTYNSTNYSEKYQGTYGSTQGNFLPIVETPTTTPITGVTLSSNSPVVGTEITATVAPSGATVTWQWYSDDAGDGVYDALSGSTSSTYTPDSYRVGCHIRCIATGSGNYTGTATATTTNTTTAAKTPITGVTLSSDSPIVGTELSASASPSGATVTWQWSRCGSTSGTFDDITDAISATYTPVIADAGKYLKCTATGSNDYAGTVSAISTDRTRTATRMAYITYDGSSDGEVIIRDVYGALVYRGTMFPRQDPHHQDSFNSVVTRQTGWVGNSSLWVAFSEFVAILSLNSGNSYAYELSGNTGHHFDEDDYLVYTGNGLPEIGVIPLTGVTLSTDSPKIGTAIVATIDPTGATVIWQWSKSLTSDGEYTDISGSGESTYTPTFNDIDYYLRCTATGTGNYGGSSSANTLNAVAKISITSVVLSTSSPSMGNQITTTISPSDATVSFQWSRSSSSDGSYTDISDATTSSYTPTSDDYENYIKCTATGTGKYTGIAFATTSAVTGTKLLTPTGLSCTSFGSDVLAIRWNSPSFSPSDSYRESYYKLEYATSSNFSDKLTIEHIHYSFLFLENLTSSTTYYIRIIREAYPSTAGDLGYLDSDATSAITATTLTTGASGALIVTNTNDTGSGSLRQILLDCPSGKEFYFQQALNGSSISLETSISLTKKINIDATNLSNGIIIDGQLIISGSGTSEDWIHIKGLKFTNNGNIKVTGDYIEISQCEFYSSQGVIDLDSNYVHRLIDRCKIRNITFQSAYSSVFGTVDSNDSATPALVRNCLIADIYAVGNAVNYFCGLSAYRVSGNSFRSRSIEYENCTIVNVASSHNQISYDAFDNTINSIKISSGTNAIFYDATNSTVLSRNYHLLPSASYVNSGDNSLVTSEYDLDGNQRIQGTVDLGCYEVQPSSTLSVPSNITFSSITSSSLQLSFDGDANSTSFILEYGTSSDFSESTTTSFVSGSIVSGLSAGNNYYFRIKAVGDGAYYASSTWSYTASQSTKGLLSPPSSISASSSSAGKSAVVFSTVANATGYSLRYSANSDMSASVDIASYSSESEISDLTHGTTLYFQVKAIGDNNWEDSIWSATASCFIKKKLNAPTNPDTTALSATCVRITFNTVANASSYEIQYDTNQYFTNNIAPVTTNTYYLDITGLSSETIYYFRVRAIGTGNYITSEYSSLATALTPILPKLSSPALTLSVIDHDSIQVSWTAISGASSYNVQHADNSSFNNPTTLTGLASGTSVDGLPINATRYFRIQAITGVTTNASSDWSIPYNATTSREILSAPIISNLVARSSSVDFFLNDIDNADSYEYQYSTGNEFDNVVTFNSNESGSKTISNLDSTTSYYLRVRSLGSGNYENSPWSTPTSFMSTAEGSPTIEIVGDNPQYIEYNGASGATYADPGATARDAIDGNLTNSITSSGTVNLGSLSTYTRTYSVTDSDNNTTTATRSVIVRDTFPPVIKLKRNNIEVSEPEIIEYNSVYTPPTISAIDACDGNLSSSVTSNINQLDTSILGEQTVIYTVSDNSGNVSTKNHIILVKDTVAPIVTLADENGDLILDNDDNPCDTSYSLAIGETLPNFGAVATDNHDGGISDRINITSDYNPNKAGTYTQVFTAVDASGNISVPRTRTIVVTDETAPIIKLYGGRFFGVPQNGYYVEPGAVAFDNNDNPVIVHASSIIKITDFTTKTGTAVDSISTANAGVYKITYSASDESGNSATPVIRYVFIQTSNAPDVELKGEDNESVSVGDTYVERGIIATDYEGNAISNEGFGHSKIWKVITSRTGTEVNSIDTSMGDNYLIRYFVMDSNENATLVTRIVNVIGKISDDPNNPIIINTTLALSLNGLWEYGIVVGQAWTDPGYSSNFSSGDYTVETIGTVDINTIGRYELVYKPTDKKGNKGKEVKRTVYVVDKNAPNIVLEGINPDYISLNNTYIDPGATVTDFEKIPLQTGTTRKIRNRYGVEFSAINSGVYDQFYITYLASVDNKDAIPQTRCIWTTGWSIPSLKLIGTDYVLKVGDVMNDPGAIAKDVTGSNISTITREVINEKGTIVEWTSGIFNTSTTGIFTLKYTAVDSRGYSSIPITRKITIVSIPKPTIEIRGDNPQIIRLNREFTEQYVNARDEDGSVLEYSIVYKNSNNTTIENIPTNLVSSYYVVYSTSNSYGQTATVNRTINVIDVDSPSLTLIGDSTINLIVGETYNEEGAFASDSYDGALNVSTVYRNSLGTVVNSISTGQAGHYTVSYTAVNSSLKSTTIVRDVAIIAQNAPTIKLKGSAYREIEVGSSVSYTEEGIYLYQDGVEVVGTYESSIKRNGISVNSVDVSLKGNYIISYTGIYNNVRSKTIERIVIVKDSTPPSITLNGNRIISFYAGSVWIDPGALSIDNSGETIEVITEGEVNSSTPGSYAKTYSAIDSSGNKSETLTRTINVLDPNGPKIILKEGDVSVEIGTQQWTDPGWVVFDKNSNIIEDAEVTFIIENSNKEQVYLIETDDFRSYKVFYTAKDIEGRYSQTVCRKIDIIDTTPPNVYLNGEQYLHLSIGSPYIEKGVSFSDNYKKSSPTLTTVIYENSIAVNNIVESVSTTAPTTFFIVYRVSDSSGNITELTRTIYVEDITAPLIVLTGDNPVSVEAGSIYIDAGATATDNIDNTPTLSGNGNVDTSHIGDYSYVWTATDVSGNTSSISRIVHVRDTVAPSISLNEPSGLLIIEKDSLYEDPGATSTDSFEGDCAVTFVIRDSENNAVEDFSTMTATLGDYTIIYASEDSSGNAATTVSRNVHVVIDVTPPVITITDNQEFYVYNIDGEDVYAIPSASAFDVYDNRTWNIIANGEDSDITTNVDNTLVGEYEIEYSATDASGNEATKTLPVYVTSEIAPVITLTGDTTLRVVQGTSFIEPGCSAVDSNNTAIEVTTTGTVNTNIPGIYRLKYTAIDSNDLPAVPKFRTVEVVPNITATPLTATTVQLDWTKAVNGVYTLESSSDGENWTAITEYVSRETSYVSQASRIVIIPANTVVYFRTKRTGSTFYSESIQTRSYAVTGLSATVPNKTTVSLNWNAMEPGTKFIVQKIDETGNVTYVKTAANNFTDNTLDVTITPNILYTFKVKTSLSGLVETTEIAGSSEITNLQVLYRSGYIKLWWNTISGATYEISRTGGNNGTANYTSNVSPWYNTRYSGTNGPFEYNTDYTYSVKAIRNSLTPFASSISTNALIYSFDDFTGVNYYYIGGEYGSFQKREDWSLEMLGDPLDFPPQFGENYRYCIGTDATIDELPGSYENKSDKGCLNLKIFDDKTVEIVSSYEQVEILHTSIDGDLTIRLNVSEETFFDPVGVTKGVHLGLYDTQKSSTVRYRGKFEITENSILRCYGTGTSMVCLTDNLETISLNINKTAKIYANVNRQDRPFCCWMACFGWERDRLTLSSKAESPLTITNDVYVGDLLIPVNPNITGNYRRFFVENDIFPSPTSKFYWGIDVINISTACSSRKEISGVLLPVDSDSKSKAFSETLSDLSIPVFHAVMPYDKEADAATISKIDLLVEGFVVNYFTWVSKNNETWPNAIDSYKTAFIEAIKASLGTETDDELVARKKLADDIIIGVGRCLNEIEKTYSSSRTKMTEKTEICLIGNNNQTLEFVKGVEFIYPIRIMKRRGKVRFVDFIGTVRGRCGFENCESVINSGISVDANSKLSFYEDSIISEITLYGTIFIDEDIELRSWKSIRGKTSRVEGYSRNPNKTGGYLYINDTSTGYSDPNMYFGTWTIPTHYYYIGGITGSFLTASDWSNANGATLTSIPIRRNGNVFHIEKNATITGLSTSQITNPADAAESGKISIVVNETVSIDSVIDYNHIDTVVVNGGSLTFEKTSYIAFLEIYAGSMAMPKGYVRTLTFAFPSSLNGGYYLDAPEPVDWDVTCRSTGVTFDYCFLSGDINAYDSGKIASVGNDIFLREDSSVATSGEANHLYVYGTGVVITGNHKFLGVYGSVTATGNIDEIQVYDGGSLTFNGETDSATIYGTSTINGYADYILVNGTATICSCFATIIVASGATANIGPYNGYCKHHDGTKTNPHYKRELYISGMANVSTEVKEITVTTSGSLTISASPTTLTNSGTTTTTGNIIVESFYNYGSTNISSGYLRVTKKSARYLGSTVSGAGQYQLPWLYIEDEDDGTITAFVQDYDIPSVTGVKHDALGVWWKQVKNATNYTVRVYDESE